MTLFSLLFISGFILGQSGTIAYVSGPNQSAYQLMTIDPASGNSKPAGQGDHDAFPQWSPDGRCIAYQSKQTDGTGIRIAYPFESRDEGLKHQFSWNYKPKWSPCGKMLAYSSDGDADPLQAIMVYTLETGEEKIWGGDHRGMVSPVWLATTDLMKALDPDEQISAKAAGLFELKEEAEKFGVLTAVGLIGGPPRISTELFVVTLSKALPLLPLLSSDSSRYVKYSVNPDHDARQIAYESNDGGDRELFILGRRGITNISNHPAADWNPIWSPDDTWLAFESFRNGRRGVFRVLANTANVFPIITGENYDCWDPDWSPDGKWLVFISDMTGIPQLFIIRPDGSDLKQLTKGDIPSLAPAWQPKSPEKEE